MREIEIRKKQLPLTESIVLIIARTRPLRNVSSYVQRPHILDGMRVLAPLEALHITIAHYSMNLCPSAIRVMIFTG